MLKIVFIVRAIHQLPLRRSFWVKVLLSKPYGKGL